MAKIKIIDIISITPSIFLIVITLFLYIVTDYNTILLNVLIITIFLSILMITFSLGYVLSDKAEANLKDDEKLLEMQKGNAALMWGYLSAIGFAFLISGIDKIADKPIPAISGLILLIAGN